MQWLPPRSKRKWSRRDGKLLMLLRHGGMGMGVACLLRMGCLPLSPLGWKMTRSARTTCSWCSTVARCSRNTNSPASMRARRASLCIPPTTPRKVLRLGWFFLRAHFIFTKPISPTWCICRASMEREHSIRTRREGWVWGGIAAEMLTRRPLTQNSVWVRVCPHHSMYFVVKRISSREPPYIPS